MALLIANGVTMPEGKMTEYTVKLEDVDGPNSGRGENGVMVRDRVRSGIHTIAVTFEMLTKAQASQILSAIEPASFNCIYHDTKTATTKTGLFYAADEGHDLTANIDNSYWSGKLTFVEF